MTEYKTKMIEIAPQGDYTLRWVVDHLADILPKHDEPGWEVCGIITAPHITHPPFEVAVLYRKIAEPRYVAPPGYGSWQM